MEVYPRVGGGTNIPVLEGDVVSGLSPRGRGNHPGCLELVDEPSRTVYPRVGGGTRLSILVGAFKDGLSPRGRGNRFVGPPVHQCYRVYPRVGGGTARWPPAGSDALQRSIPAWAGEPSSSLPARGPPPVYPRVGGGTPQSRLSMCAHPCLSPRGRGNHQMIKDILKEHVSIPAWAGEPYLHGIRGWLVGVYPRVGGGTAGVQSGNPASSCLSPRGRGNPERELRGCRHKLSIPAWAGEPATSY